jgi:hypothetical protein
MARARMTDMQVEAEIAKLQKSDFVKLAKKEENLKNRRRQQLCKLRSLELRGRQLASEGITLKNMKQELFIEDLDKEVANERH